MTSALLAALAGAFGYGSASVLQAWAATRASGPAVVRHPAYLLGLVLDLGAWLASLFALHALPLFTVQALLAGSLVVTVILGRFALHLQLSRRDVVTIGLVSGALVVVVAAAGPPSYAPPPSWFTITAMIGLVVVVAALLAWYQRGSLALAAVAGAAFSGAALCARTMHLSGSALSLVQTPLVWLAAGFGAVGALAYARALEHGAVGPATAVLWLVEVILPGVVGVGILGDRVRPGWTLPAVAAVALAVVACSAMALEHRERRPR